MALIHHPRLSVCEGVDVNTREGHLALEGARLRVAEDI